MKTELNPSAIAPESISREMLNKELVGELSGKVELYVLDFTIWDVESLYNSGVPGSMIRVDAHALSDAIDQGKIIAIKTDSSFNGLTIVDAYKEDMIYLVFSSNGGCYSVDVELNGEFRLDNIGYFSYSGVTGTLRELSSGVQTNEESIESLEVIVEDLQNMKIDKEADDYYPQLSVGLADNLAGREDATPSEIGFRKSGGGAILDGNARIESIKGNSVVWNQLAKDFASGSWRVTDGTYGSLSFDNGVAKYVVKVAGTSYAYGICTTYACAVQSHKHLLCLDAKSSVDGIFLGYDVANSGGNFSNQISTSGFSKHYVLVTCLHSGAIFICTRKGSVVGAEIQIKNIQFIDLTQMFGAGNEPSTVEEFYARIPQNIDLNAYNEGEVIHNNTDAVKSVGFNQWDEEWEVGEFNANDGSLIAISSEIRSKYPIKALPNTEYKITSPAPMIVFAYDISDKFIKQVMYGGKGDFTTPQGTEYIRFCTYNGYGGAYKNDICVNISDTSRNGTYEPYISREQNLDIIGKYFPNGMKSAGTAHDEIRYNKATQKWEAVKRIGEVDLGTLNWTYNNRYFCTYSIKFNISQNSFYSKYNALCGKYLVTMINNFANIEKGFAVWKDSESTNTYLGIRDTSYTDAAAFKAAMNGVMLYYELAVPVVTEIEEDINLDYEVWNGGTEQAIADTPSTPLKADIVYGFNAYGVIKDLREQVATMQAMMAQMQLAMSSMTTPASLDETPPSEE